MILKTFTYFIILFFIKSALFANTQYFQEGLSLYNSKKFDEAKFKFEQDLIFNPKSELSYLYLSKIFKNQKKKDLEEQNLKAVILLNPKNEEAILMLMKIGLKRSNYSKVKDLSKTFTEVCKKLCNENKEILETLANIEPKNES